MGKYKNTLFINFGGIGDEILFLPTLKAFKETYPDSKITLVLESRSKSIKDLTQIIDEIIMLDIKIKGIKKYINILKFIFSVWFKKFDCVVSSGKNPFIAIILFLTGIKERVGYCSKTDFLLTKKIKLNENQYAAKMYYDLVKPITTNEYSNPEIDISDNFRLSDNITENSYVVIHPGVSKMSVQKNILKCPNVEFWINLLNELLKRNEKILLLGTDDDKNIIKEILKHDEICNNPNFINFYKKTKNIMEMAFLMKYSKCVICVDSAPLHVAVGVNARTFAIFGPTNEKKLVPEKSNITIIKNNKISCRPCLWHKKSQNCTESSCLNIDYHAISDKI